MLNVAVVVGRLTADPELRYTPSNTAVMSFTIAVSRSYVKQGEERQTDFIDVVAWRSTAEFVAKYFKRGNQIGVQGSIQTRNYEDKNGNKRKAVEIVADNVHFVESKSPNSIADALSKYTGLGSPEVDPPHPSEFADDFAEIDNDFDVPF